MEPKPTRTRLDRESPSARPRNNKWMEPTVFVFPPLRSRGDYPGLLVSPSVSPPRFRPPSGFSRRDKNGLPAIVNR